VGIALRQYWCLLDEGLVRALWLVAAKPADSQIDDRRSTRGRNIAMIALVTAVERLRPRAAMGTACASRFTADRDMHDVIAQLYLLDNEPFARRQQQLWFYGPPYGWPSDPPGRRGLPEESGLLQLAGRNLDIPMPRDSTASLGRSSRTGSGRCTQFDPEPACRRRWP
jgi:hypothetical protein